MTNSERASCHPWFRTHLNTGNRYGRWSIRVSGNWRVAFCVAGAEVELVDCLDDDWDPDQKRRRS